MKEYEIVEIFKKLSIRVTRINKVTNSYSSNVFIVESKRNKYIFKILYNDTKRKTEKEFLEYLYDYIKVPKLISSGKYKNYNYNILEFVSGLSYKDNEGYKLIDKQIYDSGVLLAKLHSVKTIKEDKWIEYLKSYLFKTYNYLNNKIDFNNEIYDYLSKEIDNIKYEKGLLHLDFRIGNIMYNHKLTLIDFESVKVGDMSFDFLKMKRALSTKQYAIFKQGYKSIKKLPKYLEKNLKFYKIFDSYTSMGWCVERNQMDSDFYKTNYDYLKGIF